MIGREDHKEEQSALGSITKNRRTILSGDPINRGKRRVVAACDSGGRGIRGYGLSIRGTYGSDKAHDAQAV